MLAHTMGCDLGKIIPYYYYKNLDKSDVLQRSFIVS